MTATIKHETKESTLIEWSDETGFGQLIVKYNGHGGFNIDAEYIGFDKVVQILNSVGL